MIGNGETLRTIRKILEYVGVKIGDSTSVKTKKKHEK